MPDTINNTLEGNAEDNAKVAFRDLIEKLEVNIGNGKIQNKEHYHSFEQSNPIYNHFLKIDRKLAVQQLREYYKKVDCSGEKCSIVTIKTVNEHQPDWLFDRFYMDLQEREKEVFDPVIVNLIQEIKVTELYRKFKYRTGKEYLESLSPNKYHLIHIKIEAKNENDELHQFFKEFCTYWSEKPTTIRCLIFLSVKIRTQTKPSFLKRIFGKKKSNAIENMHLIDELEWVEKTDIESFFENHLKCFPNMKNMKPHYSIKECWLLFANEIDKIIAARQKH
jgi:hypothetical protein